MALEISKSDTAKLTISGTNTELDSVYGRIQFTFEQNGSNSRGEIYLYQDKSYYDSGQPSALKIKELASPCDFSFTIDIATEEQSLQTGSEAAKQQLESLGYSVAIIDL